jgi:hypothetical protein
MVKEALDGRAPRVYYVADGTITGVNFCKCRWKNYNSELPDKEPDGS